MGMKLLLPVVLLAALMLLSVTYFMMLACSTSVYVHTSGADAWVMNRVEKDAYLQSHTLHSELEVSTLGGENSNVSLTATTTKILVIANSSASNSQTLTTLETTLSESVSSSSRQLPQAILPLDRHKGVSSINEWPPSTSASTIACYQQPNCSDKLCSQYLSSSDQAFFHRCQMMSQSTDSKAQCRFMDGRGRDPVGLVSVPGAGNTWVRGLLEKATGICTGAIYCDPAIKRGGFAGEYVHSGSVIVVKTHTSDFQWKGTNPEKLNHEDAHYGSVILLVRNPFDTFVAERNRVITLNKLGGQADHGVYHPPPLHKLDDSHVHEIGAEYFGNNSDWINFVNGIGERWRKTIDKWFLHAGDHPIMVVRFEDVKKDKVTEVKRMLDFLNFTCTTDEVRERLVRNQGYSSFRRKHVHHEGHMYHYTAKQIGYVNSLLQETILLLQKHGVEHIFRLREYICC